MWSNCNMTTIKWDKVFKNGPSKICGKQLLKKLKWYGPFLNTFSQILFNAKTKKENQIVMNAMENVV